MEQFIRSLSKTLGKMNKEIIQRILEMGGKAEIKKVRLAEVSTSVKFCNVCHICTYHVQCSFSPTIISERYTFQPSHLLPLLSSRSLLLMGLHIF